MDSYFLHCCMHNMSDCALYLPLQPTSVIAECTVIALLPALVPRPIVYCMYVSTEYNHVPLSLEVSGRCRSAEASQQGSLRQRRAQGTQGEDTLH